MQVLWSIYVFNERVSYIYVLGAHGLDTQRMAIFTFRFKTII